MPDKDSVYDSARRLGGKPHGEDATGLADIEFPNIHNASSWAAGWSTVTSVTLRAPVVDLTSPVVLQVQL